MKKLISIMFIVILGLTASSCGKEENISISNGIPTTKISEKMNSGQVNTSTASESSSKASVVKSDSSKKITSKMTSSNKVSSVKSAAIPSSQKSESKPKEEASSELILTSSSDQKMDMKAFIDKISRISAEEIESEDDEIIVKMHSLGNKFIISYVHRDIENINEYENEKLLRIGAKYTMEELEDEYHFILTEFKRCVKDGESMIVENVDASGNIIYKKEFK